MNFQITLSMEHVNVILRRWTASRTDLFARSSTT